MEELPISKGVSAGCQITMSGILVLNCPNQHMVYSTHNYIKYGNRGVQDYGGNFNLTAVHKIVEKDFTGHVAALNPLKKSLVKFFDTGADIGGAEVYPFTLFYYNFPDRLKDFVIYDMDYVILVFESNMLAYLNI